MKLVNLTTFFDTFGKAGKPRMNMSIYRESFKCACGKSHWFDESIKIVCEGTGMKIAVLCPEEAFITSLKIKTFMVFKFKGFESISGAQIKTEGDAVLLASVFKLMRLQ